MGGAPLLHVTCTGQGPLAGGLALLCAPWAALQFPAANADAITFASSWVRALRRCGKSGARWHASSRKLPVEPGNSQRSSLPCPTRVSPVPRVPANNAAPQQLLLSRVSH